MCSLKRFSQKEPAGPLIPIRVPNEPGGRQQSLRFAASRRRALAFGSRRNGDRLSPIIVGVSRTSEGRSIFMAERTPLHDQTSAAGAVFVEEAGFLLPAHFGDARAEYNAARQVAVLVDQSSHGKIEVRGADAVRFLHNLTTNDILHLPPGSGCEAFLTTTKAKVIAYLLIYRHAD